MLAFLAGPTVKIADQRPLLTGLQAKIVCFAYVAAVPHRWAGGVGILSGSGLSANSGY